MHTYWHLGDQVGTNEARDLAKQLVAWHDAMVRHLRVVGPQRGTKCIEDCPHEEAALLWSMAQGVFGGRANALTFLRSHGHAHLASPSRARRKAA